MKDQNNFWNRMLFQLLRSEKPTGKVAMKSNKNYPLCLIGLNSPLGGWESWGCFQTCVPVLGPVRVTNNVWRAQFFYKIDLLTYHRFESWVILSKNSCQLSEWIAIFCQFVQFCKKCHTVLLCCYYLRQWCVEFELTWICLKLSFLIKC